MNTVIRKTILAISLAGFAAPMVASQHQQTEQEQKLAVADKRSGLTPAAFAGILAGTGLALYGTSKTLEKRAPMNWEDTLTVGWIAALWPAITYVREKLERLDSSGGGATIPDPMSLQQAGFTDKEIEITHARINEITKAVGLKQQPRLWAFPSHTCSAAAGPSYTNKFARYWPTTQPSSLNLYIPVNEIRELISDEQPCSDAMRFVTGHEVVHLREDHSKKRQTLNLALPLLTYCGVKLGGQVLKNSPASCDSLGLALTFLAYLIPEFISNAYDRSCEKEADRESARATGYAQAGADYFKKDITTEDRLVNFSALRYLQGHPTFTERVAYLEKIAQTQAAQPAPANKAHAKPSSLTDDEVLATGI